MLLSKLQQLLGRIYDLPVGQDVGDFVLTDASVVEAASGSAGDEQLLVSQSADALEIALFLDARVLQRLTVANPLESLTEQNLADYLTAIEGVSHFVCVAWNASHDKSVSILELELQAEVDKFVSCAWLLHEQGDGRFPRELHHTLFERVRIDRTLAGARAGLYRAATQHAARYCQALAAQWSERRRAVSLDVLADLRRFYRLGMARKLTHIASCA
jgi:hypothetical protein